MKYEIKPNQSRIVKSKPVVNRTIRAIKIDTFNKEIIEVKSSNSISEIQKHNDFYNYQMPIIKREKKHIF